MKGVRGFALLAVLWLVTALSVLATLALGVARTGAATTRNRILLARSAWAREACVEILLARYTQRPATRGIDSVDFGRGTWCRAVVVDPSEKLNVNSADADALTAVLSVQRPPPLPSVIRTILLSRPFPDVRAIADVPGVDSSLAARLDSVLTTRGPGQVNVNAAPPNILITLPGMSGEAVRAIQSARMIGQPITNADELAARISPVGRQALSAEYQAFVRQATFSAGQLVVTAEGGVRSTPIVSRETLTCIPRTDRLAVIRREVE